MIENINIWRKVFRAKLRKAYYKAKILSILFYVLFSIIILITGKIFSKRVENLMISPKSDTLIIKTKSGEIKEFEPIYLIKND